MSKSTARWIWAFAAAAIAIVVAVVTGNGLAAGLTGLVLGFSARLFLPMLIKPNEPQLAPVTVAASTQAQVHVQQQSSAPAGWYPDPRDATNELVRYFDGQAWTEHTNPKPPNA